MTATTGPSPGPPAADVVTQLVTMTFAPEHEQAFLDLAAEVVDQVGANEPDTLLYVLTERPDRPHTYVWIERYRDERALATHSGSPYLAAALEQLPAWWSEPPEIQRFPQILSAGPPVH